MMMKGYKAFTWFIVHGKQIPSCYICIEMKMRWQTVIKN